MSKQKCKLWENFNKNTKDVAKAKDMDIKVVAEKAGMSRQSIYAYFSGRLQPGLDRIEMIAAALKVDPIKLLADPSTIDAADLAAGGEGQAAPEDMLDDEASAALAIGREVMALQDHELLLDVCRHVGPERIRRVCALLLD